MSKIKDPEEKKAKSYDLDRRNVYGESSHGARKSIPRGKARAHRAERHEVRQLQRLSGFRKVPDEPLGVLVARKLESRVADDGAKKERRAARRS